ncbi:MAG: SAM-dependent methyltransferase [Lutibacter sp.]|uniref:SAM-dependent methyltransferase n=1 Tax=Lutibacter sp. TaxID=1925666 RepID=UPI00385FA0AF
MSYKKNKNDLDKCYWETKYAKNSIGWDIGYLSTPLESYFKQLTNKSLKILIPGAGNSYEAEYLHKLKFSNVHVMDIALQPILNLKSRVPTFPDDNLIQTDFFSHNDTYDLIVEQTFFCSFHPRKRVEYVKKMADLLGDKGKLIGVFFDFKLIEEGPPFGGSLNEYLQLFSTLFNIKTLERCHNSIKPRLGNELFFIFEKK